MKGKKMMMCSRAMLSVLMSWRSVCIIPIRFILCLWWIRNWRGTPIKRRYMASPLREISSNSSITLRRNCFVQFHEFSWCWYLALKFILFSSLYEKPQVVAVVVHVEIRCNAYECKYFVQDGSSYNMVKEKVWGIITVQIWKRNSIKLDSE